MLQSGLIILQQYFPDGLFWRVKSDPSIIIPALLVLSRDLIRISSMSALLTLKLVPFAVRLIQITAFRTGLRGVCRIDLLSTTTCRRRLELKTIFLMSRDLFTRPFSSKIELFYHYHLRLSPLDQFVDRSIDLIRDRYFRPTVQFLRLLTA
jgi:hypothetical protein